MIIHYTDYTDNTYNTSFNNNNDSNPLGGQVHIFFCNERIGEGKCYLGAMKSLAPRLGMEEGDHRLIPGPAEQRRKQWSPLGDHPLNLERYSED